MTGFALLFGILAFGRNFPEDEQSDVLGGRGPRTVRAVLNAVSTLSPVLAGTALILHMPGALYFLIPAIVASVYVSIGYAWVFAVEIPRRREEQKKNKELGGV